MAEPETPGVSRRCTLDGRLVHHKSPCSHLWWKLRNQMNLTWTHGKRCSDSRIQDWLLDFGAMWRLCFLSNLSFNEHSHTSFLAGLVLEPKWKPELFHWKITRFWLQTSPKNLLMRDNVHLNMRATRKIQDKLESSLRKKERIWGDSGGDGNHRV